MVPKSDIERFIQAIIDDSDAPSEAKCRIEQYLTDILEERVSTLEPVFRIEYYLAKISGTNVELPEPISRADLYLAALAGEEVTLPDTPNSSLEEYLARWCETGNAVSAITGAPASFTGRTNTEIQSISVDLQPIQDLHGYDNPWPAGGGKNKLPVSTKMSSTGTVSFTNNNDGSWVVNGSSVGSSTYAPGSSKCISLGVLSAGNYVASLQHTDGQLSSILGIRIGEWSDATYLASGVGSCTFTADGTSEYWFTFMLPSNKTTSNELVWLQVEAGSSATAYAPYANICPITGRTGANVYVSPTQDVADATTYPVTWQTEAGTVYGGTVDVVSGVLTVNMASVDLGSLNWLNTSTYYHGVYRMRSATVLSDAKAPQNADIIANIISEEYVAVTETNTIKGPSGRPLTGIAIDTEGYIRVFDENYSNGSSSNPSAFKTAMNGMHLVYELATPITYQLTPQEVKSLLGVNNIWSDSGDVTVTLKGGFTD